MPLSVYRVDFNGNALSEQIEFRLSNIDVFDERRFALLKYIDPYDDTTFNGLMCRDLIKDLQELKNMQPHAQHNLDSLIELAQACIDDPHTYLKFDGD